MPKHLQLGEIPPKRHIRLARDPASSFLGEGMAYEHVVTTAGLKGNTSLLIRPANISAHSPDQPI